MKKNRSEIVDKIDIQKFIEITDVEKISSCSKRHIMEEISRGNLKAFKPGKKLLFRPEDIEKWILKKAV